LRISIVVPAHNEEALLPRCLEALFAQDYHGATEIIVVDNASTDRTAEVAHRYGAKVVHEPRRDYCLALVCGFAAATGDIVAMTDADTVPPRDWLTRLAQEYARDREVVAVGGEVTFDRPNLRGALIARVLVPAFNALDRRDPAGPHLWGSNFSVRRDAFVAVGGWNRDYSLQADSELSERLRAAGRVLMLPSIRVRTSSRRWNRAFLANLWIFVTNFIWMRLFGRPLRRDFPVIREHLAPPRTHRVRLAWAAGILILLGGLGEAAFSPRSSVFGKTYWHMPTREKVVALTFDDGPNEPCTSQVLAVLRHEHIHATFFLIGANVDRYPAAAAAIVRDGNVVGNHTEHHPVPFALESVPQLESEVATAEETIGRITGSLPRFFRPPQGLESPWLKGVLAGDSLINVTWDDAPGDWDPISSATIAARAVEHAEPGSIILLHDGMNLTHGADQGATVRALPAIIRELRARGYRFVTVPELLHCCGTLAAWPPRTARLHT
jgi:peptidoglycan-N-acetylglucosamine deacetylase